MFGKLTSLSPYPKYISFSDKAIRSLASELNHIKITKADISWPLEEHEKLAREIQEEEEEEEDSDDDDV
jgi:hypothetical protein